METIEEDQAIRRFREQLDAVWRALADLQQHARTMYPGEFDPRGEIGLTNAGHVEQALERSGGRPLAVREIADATGLETGAIRTVLYATAKDQFERIPRKRIPGKEVRWRIKGHGQTASQNPQMRELVGAGTAAGRPDD